MISQLFLGLKKLGYVGVITGFKSLKKLEIEQISVFELFISQLRIGKDHSQLF